MRKVATVVLAGLGGVCLVAIVSVQQGVGQTSMLNSNTASSAVAASQASPQINSSSELWVTVSAIRQPTSSSMPAGVGSLPASHSLGTMVAKVDPTAPRFPAGGYSAQLATALAPAAVTVTGGPPPSTGSQVPGAPQLSEVPSALQLSAIMNAAGGSLAGMTPTGRTLGK